MELNNWKYGQFRAGDLNINVIDFRIRSRKERVVETPAAEAQDMEDIKNIQFYLGNIYSISGSDLI